MAAVRSWKRPGKPGWYFRVLNCASENGLSSDTWGRLSERVTPRSASSCAVHLLVIGAPRSECRVSTWGWTPCLWQVCSMTHLAGLRAALRLLKDPQPILRGELAPLRLGHDLRVRNSTLIQCHRVSLCRHRCSPPPPYSNSKGCWCLSHVGREGRPKHAWQSSNSWKAGTTPDAATPLWATSAPTTSNVSLRWPPHVLQGRPAITTEQPDSALSRSTNWRSTTALHDSLTHRSWVRFHDHRRSLTSGLVTKAQTRPRKRGNSNGSVSQPPSDQMTACMSIHYPTVFPIDPLEIGGDTSALRLASLDHLLTPSLPSFLRWPHLCRLQNASR